MKNIDEAAEDYVQTLCDRVDDNLRIDTTLQSAFKAGAEWMAGQGKSIVGKIGLATKKIHCTISEKTLDSLGVRANDEIVIQVRKK